MLDPLFTIGHEAWRFVNEVPNESLLRVEVQEPSAKAASRADTFPQRERLGTAESSVVRGTAAP